MSLNTKDEEVWLGLFPTSVDCVYFIYSQDAALWKIGTTNRLAHRLRTLKNISPVRLDLQFALRGDRNIELAYHWQYQRRRDHGEWFRLTHEDIMEIRQGPVPYPAIGRIKAIVPSAEYHKVRRTQPASRRLREELTSRERQILNLQHAKNKRVTARLEAKLHMTQEEARAILLPESPVG